MAYEVVQMKLTMYLDSAYPSTKPLALDPLGLDDLRTMDSKIVELQTIADRWGKRA